MGQGNHTVVSRVRSAMQDARISQNDMADATGIARPTLQRRLLGHTPFTVTELFLIAEVLEVEAASFLTEAPVAA